jgi:hypothetical protein
VRTNRRRHPASEWRVIEIAKIGDIIKHAEIAPFAALQFSDNETNAIVQNIILHRNIALAK